VASSEWGIKQSPLVESSELLARNSVGRANGSIIQLILVFCLVIFVCGMLSPLLGMIIPGVGLECPAQFDSIRTRH